MKTWIITDTHFGHRKLENWGRPKDFEQPILEAIEYQIKKGDTLIHLGDVCIGKDEEAHRILMEAIGPDVHKILVKGNHDHKSDSWYMDHGWDFVCESFSKKFLGKHWIFTHAPIERDSSFAKGFFRNVHGHFHGNNHRLNELVGTYDPAYHYDAAPDIHDFKPVLLEDILNK